MDDHENENNDTPRPTDPRPLGYWLRVVDGLLTREFAEALGSEGIDRRDWMVLNVLSGDVDAPELRERLTRKGKRLRTLEDRGWVAQQGDGTWTLTGAGRAEKERIGAIVDGIRSRVVGAVGDEAYAAMTASLESIARELGWNEDAADRGFSGFGRRAGFGGEGVPGFRPGFGPGWGSGRGFGPGFGGRPRPFDPDIHDGYGRNRHRGFAPGRPGHPAERFDEPFSSESGDTEGCHGHHPHAGHGHRDHEGRGHDGFHGYHGHGHEGHGHDGFHGYLGHGHHGFRGHSGSGAHGFRGHRDGDRRAQRAYERGFDAGFLRGREYGAA
jgi:hypothetical protein